MDLVSLMYKYINRFINSDELLESLEELDLNNFTDEEKASIKKLIDDIKSIKNKIPNEVDEIEKNRLEINEKYVNGIDKILQNNTLENKLKEKFLKIREGLLEDKKKVKDGGKLYESLFTLLAGCESKKETNENITKPEEISYTNKFECSRVEKIKKFDLDNKNAGRLTQEQMKERENSPVAINEKINKIYDFTKDGSKLLGFYEIHTYEYVVDGYNMDKEKSSYDCGNYEKYGFKSCEITTTNNSIVMTKVADLNSDYNKDLASKMTLESIKADYAEGDMYTCN